MSAWQGQTEPNNLSGGERNMEEMTARELDRLADWLRAQGFSPEKVLECLKYIAGTSAPATSE